MAWVRAMNRDMVMSVIISRHILEIKSIAICDELEYVPGGGGKKEGSRKDGAGLPQCSLPKCRRMMEGWKWGNHLFTLGHIHVETS